MHCPQAPLATASLAPTALRRPLTLAPCIEVPLEVPLVYRCTVVTLVKLCSKLPVDLGGFRIYVCNTPPSPTCVYVHSVT